MGIGLSVTLVVVVVLAVVALLGYVMDASVPDEGDEGPADVQPAGGVRR